MFLNIQSPYLLIIVILKFEFDYQLIKSVERIQRDSATLYVGPHMVYSYGYFSAWHVITG